MEAFWTGLPIGIGLVGSAVGLIISLRKNRTETAKGESDIKDTIVAGYESLRKALVDENMRLTNCITALQEEIVQLRQGFTERVAVLQEEIKGLRQEIITLRSDLNVERLKNEATGLSRRLDASNAENEELKRAGAPQRSVELKEELNHTTKELEKAEDVQDSAKAAS